MQILISRFEPDLQASIIQFRGSVYAASRRDPNQHAAWCHDRFDPMALHFLAYGKTGDLIGAMRLLAGAEWSLDHYFQFDYDKTQDVEFGRLAVAKRQEAGQRVLFELIYAACIWCKQNGRQNAYGFVVARFSRALVKQKVPFELLSPSISPYGEPSNLVRFSSLQLANYYQDYSHSCLA